MRPTGTTNGPCNEKVKFKPRYLSMPCPDKYRYICGYCSKRFGEPDLNGWIDIIRCEICDIKTKKHEN